MSQVLSLWYGDFDGGHEGRWLKLGESQSFTLEMKSCGKGGFSGVHRGEEELFAGSQ